MSLDRQFTFPPTLMGTVYWKDHVVAVVNDPAEAERAVVALVEAGFPADDTWAVPGPEVAQHHAAYLAGRNPLQRLGAALASDEGEMVDEFVAEAQEGHSILVVPATAPAAAERAAAVLRRHHAHHLKHFRANTVVDL